MIVDVLVAFMAAAAHIHRLLDGHASRPSLTSTTSLAGTDVQLPRAVGPVIGKGYLS